MVEFSIDLESKKLYKQLRRTGHDMPKMIERCLGRIGMEIVTHANMYYMSERGPKTLGRITGDLSQSLSAGKPGTLWELKHQELTLGTNLPYAAVHESGIGHMPKRAYLQPSIADIFNSGKADAIAEKTLQEELDKRVD